MSYIQKTLLPEEKILYHTKPHFIIFYQIFIWLLLAALASAFDIDPFFINLMLIMSFFSCIGSLINYYCSEYVITNRRILMKTGFIRRTSLEIFLDRVEGIYIDQSITGRILNFGTLIIAGVGGTKNPFFYIPDPLKFRSCIQERLGQK